MPDIRARCDPTLSNRSPSTDSSEWEGARHTRFAWVGAEAGYGKEPAYPRALEAMGEVFVADVHSTRRNAEGNPAAQTGRQGRPG